jgi:hypothetical protein
VSKNNKQQFLTNSKVFFLAKNDEFLFLLHFEGGWGESEQLKKWSRKSRDEIATPTITMMMMMMMMMNRQPGHHTLLFLIQLFPQLKKKFLHIFGHPPKANFLRLRQLASIFLSSW